MQVLGVGCEHSREELRQAYRLKSKETHPDKGKAGGDARTEFQRVATAYEVLSDAEQRRAYDNGKDVTIEQRDGTSQPLWENVMQRYFPERFDFWPFGDPRADKGFNGPQAAV